MLWKVQKAKMGEFFVVYPPPPPSQPGRVSCRTLGALDAVLHRKQC